MRSRFLLLLCTVAAVLFASPIVAHGQKIFDEAGGLVVIETESTDSPLGRWEFIETNTPGYPTGAQGTGHLEYRGPFTNPTPGDSLQYKFKINLAGRYELQLRAHKRLEGNPGDQNNDAFIKMEGLFESGNSAVPKSALTNHTKIFGGHETVWGRAWRLDGNGAHLQAPLYDFEAGEIYTLTLSGRSTRFNVDRIVISQPSLHDVNFSNIGNQPISGLVSSVPEPMLGDTNMDGVVSFLDVAPFIAILTSGVFQVEADISGDGAVNFTDIGPFIGILSSN